MRIPKRGEKGFTLIELLIVVAILGVLAAVIIPNVSRFFGAGEEEARDTEKSNVQLAMDSMMIDNGIDAIPAMAFEDGPPAVGGATQNMGAFPDSTSSNAVPATPGKVTGPDGTYTFPGDLPGYLLYGHDVTANAAATELENYMRESTTEYFYTCDADGTVHQYSDANMTTEY